MFCPPFGVPLVCPLFALGLPLRGISTPVYALQFLCVSTLCFAIAMPCPAMPLLCSALLCYAIALPSNAMPPLSLANATPYA